jgi:putative ABC transport system permease protein
MRSRVTRRVAPDAVTGDFIVLSQALAITGINIRSIPERWAPSSVIVIGLAGVVAVFTALLAMAAGFESTLEATGGDAVYVGAGGGRRRSSIPRSTATPPT